ncbi:MAG: metallophosphoesterase family protein [Prevotella sp.]
MKHLTLSNLRSMLCLALIVAASCPAVAQTLKFNASKTIKIVQFTDVHWKPGNPESSAAAQCINAVLDAERPDLVVYTGDIAFDKPAFEALDSAFAPVIKRGIPFAYTFGNHDDEQDRTRQEILSYVMKQPGCLTTTAPGVSGMANFALPIKSADGRRDAAVIYVFDSNSYSPIKEIKGYAWLNFDQIDWYRNRSEAYTRANGGSPLPSIVFQHIPVPEYNYAAQDERSRFIGKRFEEACAPKINTGEFAAMRSAGDVMAMFAGHDHINNYSTLYHGILLSYGQYTGGRTVYCPRRNGARVIELTQDSRTFTTWLRMADGEVVDRITCPDDFTKE